LGSLELLCPLGLRDDDEDDCVLLLLLMMMVMTMSYCDHFVLSWRKLNE